MAKIQLTAIITETEREVIDRWCAKHEMTKTDLIKLMIRGIDEDGLLPQVPAPLVNRPRGWRRGAGRPRRQAKGVAS